MLTPAACYPLYPTVAKRGSAAESGRLYDLQSYCFRHEPSKDPARMQMFRMREFVTYRLADQVQDFRESWLDRGQKMMASLGVPLKVDLANDPFFGRAGKMLANNQRDTGLSLNCSSGDERRKADSLPELQLPSGPLRSLWDIRTQDGGKSTYRLRRLRYGARRACIVSSIMVRNLRHGRRTFARCSGADHEGSHFGPRCGDVQTPRIA